MNELRSWLGLTGGERIRVSEENAARISVRHTSHHRRRSISVVDRTCRWPFQHCCKRYMGDDTLSIWFPLIRTYYQHFQHVHTPPEFIRADKWQKAWNSWRSPAVYRPKRVEGYFNSSCVSKLAFFKNKPKNAYQAVFELRTIGRVFLGSISAASDGSNTQI